jgi:hypothetical protein
MGPGSVLGGVDGTFSLGIAISLAVEAFGR